MSDVVGDCIGDDIGDAAVVGGVVRIKAHVVHGELRLKLSRQSISESLGGGMKAVQCVLESSKNPNVIISIILETNNHLLSHFQTPVEQRIRRNGFYLLPKIDIDC